MKIPITLIVGLIMSVSACSRPPTAGGDSSATVLSPTPGASPDDTFQSSQGPISIHPINHASLLLRWAGKSIFVDPTKLGSVLGLPKATHVLLTDIHHDHFDQEGIDRVKDSSTVYIGPKILEDKVPRLVVLENGEAKTIDGMRFEAVPMYNLQRGPSAGKLYHDKGRGNGYVIGLADKRIYVSGDTECIAEMKTLKNIDIAFLCMNLPYTMPPEEAAQCAKIFRPAVVFPYHSRGSNLEEFQRSLAAEPAIDVRIRNWY